MNALDQLAWLTNSDVSELFGVRSKTVARWAERGYLHGVRVIEGSHRRYSPHAIYAAMHARDTLAGIRPMSEQEFGLRVMRIQAKRVDKRRQVTLRNQGVGGTWPKREEQQ